MSSKFVTFYSVDPKKHFKKTNSGNGSAIRQYELVDDVVTPKVDKDGKPVFHSLYDDIQKNKSANDYKRIIEQVGLAGFSDATKSSIDWKAVDVSDIGTYNDLVKSNAKVQNTLNKYDVKDLSELAQKLFGNKKTAVSEQENKKTSENNTSENK